METKIQKVMETKIKKVYKGSVDIQVKIIDWTKINEIISEKVGHPVKCNIGNGFIPFKKDGKQEYILIDNECCGCSSENRNFFISDLNESEPFSLNLFKGIGFFKIYEKSEDGNQSVAMFPSYYFDIDVDDVIKCSTNKEQSLYEYMGNRYRYNSRIQNNESEILNLVYGNNEFSEFNDYLVEVEKEVSIH
jgi:hypothetical protein